MSAVRHAGERMGRRDRKDPNSVQCMTAALAFVAISFLASQALAVNISLCDGPAQGGCVCLYFTGTQGQWMEVRCSDQYGQTVLNPAPPTWPPDGTGSFRGPGMSRLPPDPLPGMPLTTQQISKLNAARSVAIQKLRKYREPDFPPGVTLATTCSALFDNSPLGRPGVDLLQNYAVFRNGVGVKDSSGATPCNGSSRAWTTCCQHDPVVFLCTSFGTTNTTEAAYFLIHEILHVAGQYEDKNSTFGPNDPPNSGQIQTVVREACENPQVIE